SMSGFHARRVLAAIDLPVSAVGGLLLCLQHSLSVLVRSPVGRMSWATTFYATFRHALDHPAIGDLELDSVRASLDVLRLVRSVHRHVYCLCNCLSEYRAVRLGYVPR